MKWLPSPFRRHTPPRSAPRARTISRIVRRPISVTSRIGPAARLGGGDAGADRALPRRDANALGRRLVGVAGLGVQPELALLGVAQPDADDALALQTVAHQLGQPVQDLGEVQRAGQQATSL